MRPQVIVISGSSGSGKTALSKALQEALLPAVWLGFSVDKVIYSLPGSVLERCNGQNDWSGVDGKALNAGAFACLRSLVDTGNKVIFDVVLSRQEEVDHLKRLLYGVEVCSVALRCEWPEIERRTLARGDRSLEEVEKTFKSALAYSFDTIELDTSDQTPKQIAEDLLSRIGPSSSWQR